MILRRRDDNSSPETKRRNQLLALQLGLDSAQANQLQVRVNLTENRGISPDKVYDKMFNKQHEAERNNKRKRKPSKKSALPASAPLLSARNNKRKRKPITCEPSPKTDSQLMVEDKAYLTRTAHYSDAMLIGLVGNLTNLLHSI